MTVQSISQGIRVPIEVKLTTTSATDLFSNDNAIAYLDEITICNISGAQDTIDIWVVNGANSFYRFKDYPIAAKGTLQFTNMSWEVGNGRTLRAQAATADAFDITGTVLLQVASQGRNSA